MREPISKAELRLPQAAAVILRAKGFDIGLHAGIMGFEYRFVATEQITCPGNDGGGIRPGGGGQHIPGIADEIGHHHRNHTAGKLLFLLHVEQVLAVEGIGVHVERGGGTKYLRVTRPTHAFVTLRAIRGHIEEIALLTPHRVGDEPVHLLVGGLEPTGTIHVRIDHAAREVVHGGHSRPTDHLHETEAIVREMRAQRMGFPIRNEPESLLRVPQVVLVKIAVLQDFSVQQHQFGPFGQCGLAGDPSHHVLTHVQNGFAGRRRDHGNRFACFLDKDGKAEAIHQQGFVDVE